MSDDLELAKRARARPNDAPLETEYMIDDMADAIERLNARIKVLEVALMEIAEWGPMTVDDQRWRIARAALTASHSPAQPPAPPQQSE